jgi:hypothetical protein
MLVTLLTTEVGRLLSGGLESTVEDAYQRWLLDGSPDEGFLALERDIVLRGIETPLTVVCSGPGHLQDGHTRYKIARRLGICSLPASITT